MCKDEKCKTVLVYAKGFCRKHYHRAVRKRNNERKRLEGIEAKKVVPLPPEEKAVLARCKSIMVQIEAERTALAKRMITAGVDA